MAKELVTTKESKCPGGGRGLFATSSFRARDLILSESALAAQPRPSIYSDDIQKICSYCFKFVGDLDSHIEVLAKSVSRSPPSKKAIDSVRGMFGGLPVPVSCPRGCSTNFCSTSCVEAALASSHRFSCPSISEATKELNAIVRQNPDYKFEMALQAISLIIQKVEATSLNLEKAIQEILGVFVSVPYSALIDLRNGIRAIVPEPSLFPSSFQDPVLDDNHVYIILLRNFSELGKAAVSAATSGNKYDGLFSLGFLDRLLGLFVLNCREIVVYSPLEPFFDRVQKSSSSMSFLPLILKLNGIPRVTVAALCPTYAMVNHSCEGNVANALSEAEAVAEANQSGLVSRIYAKKDISAGEELLVSYVSSSSRMSAEDKKRHFKTQYCFECKCNLCNK